MSEDILATLRSEQRLSTEIDVHRHSQSEPRSMEPTLRSFVIVTSTWPSIFLLIHNDHHLLDDAEPPITEHNNRLCNGHFDSAESIGAAVAEMRGFIRAPVS